MIMIALIAGIVVCAIVSHIYERELRRVLREKEAELAEVAEELEQELRRSEAGVGSLRRKLETAERDRDRWAQKWEEEWQKNNSRRGGST